jgi:hypothetical protein
MTEWTHATWTLFHSIPAKIKESEFEHIRGELLNYIKGICMRLPCPECSYHASIFINTVNFSNIRTPNDLKQVFYIFHNNVNTKLKKKTFDLEVLDQYKDLKFHTVLNNFFRTFNSTTKGNFTFMSENHNRKIFLDQLLVFMRRNLSRFDN